MQVPFVDLKSQYISIKKEIDIAIQNVINDSAFIKGKYVKQFEEEYAKTYGINNVVSCANGTDALYISLKALGIGEGDEVITTALSWISTSETITQTGAKVVFVDIEPDYFTIDPKKIEEKITDKTKAIIPVHLYGHPVDMDKIKIIADKYKLKIIEDCAQAHFAKWNGDNVGTIGDVGTFSFFPGKNLGAYGDAGCIITDNDILADKMRRFAGHGALNKHDHEIEGINSRLDGLQAAILSVKLKYIHKWTSLRIEHSIQYNKAMHPISDVICPSIHPLAKHVFHLYVIRSKARDNLKEYLESKGVSTGIHYPNALPFLTAYNYLNHKRNDFEVASSYTNEILSLPMFPELDSETIMKIAILIKGFFDSK